MWAIHAIELSMWAIHSLYFQCEPSILLNIDGLNLNSCKIFALEWRMSEGSELELKFEQFIAGESLRSLTSMSIKLKKNNNNEKYCYIKNFSQIMRYYVLFYFPKFQKSSGRNSPRKFKIEESICHSNNKCSLIYNSYMQKQKKYMFLNKNITNSTQKFIHNS